MKRNAEAGHALPLVALALATLMGFGGMAADVGYWRYQERQQQSATDAAAIGGAQQLLRSTCPNQAVANSAAQQDATDNNFTNAGTVTVAVSNPPSGGTFSGDQCAVMVKITSSNVPTFLTKLFGQSFVQTTTQAVARIASDNNTCIYLLSSSSTNFNGTSVNAPGCSIAMNGSANFNGATITAGSIGYAGSTPNENGASFPAGSPVPIPTVADPCPEILGCAALAAGAPASGNCTSFNGNNFHGTLPSGCYSSLSLNNATVTMSGTYVLTGTNNFNGASITGNGVTLYVTAGASAPNFNHVTAATMTPPTTGPYAGVLYYQVPSNTSGPNFNGTSVNLSGLVYCPACSVNFNGAAGGYLVLVLGSANFNGGTANDFGAPPAGQSLIRNVVLAQ